MYNQPGTNDSSQIANSVTARTAHDGFAVWTGVAGSPARTAARTRTHHEDVHPDHGCGALDPAAVHPVLGRMPEQRRTPLGPLCLAHLATVPAAHRSLSIGQRSADAGVIQISRPRGTGNRPPRRLLPWRCRPVARLSPAERG